MTVLNTHFGLYFRLLHTSADQAMTRALTDMDLTGPQGRIMGFLAHCKTPPCARDIEEAFQLSHPTVSGLLSRLEKKGFIAFRADPEDRRCKRIYILDKGRQLLDTMHQTIRNTESQLVAGFTEAEKAQFAAYLKRAICNVGADCCKRKPKEEITNHD